MTRECKQECRGFTLIELAISVMIVGLLLAGAAGAYTTYMQKQQVTRTQENINAVNDAIAAFQQENGFLPCPADPADVSAASDANPAVRSCSAAAPPPPASVTVADLNPVVPDGFGNNLRVRIGVVPVTVRDSTGNVRQLIPGEKAVDGWNNRIAYAVVEQSADPARAGAVAVSSGLKLNDSTGAAIDTSAKYVVLSRGQDGVGAYTTSGALRRACGVGSADDENCDANDTFRSIGLGGTRSTSDDANNFDDFVAGDAVSNVPAKCTGQQVVTGINWRTRKLTCGLAAEGLACPPGQALTGIQKDPSDPAKYIPACTILTPVCGSGEVLVGSTCVANITGTCPDGWVMKGINDGTGKECVQISRSCPAGMIQVGVSDGTNNDVGGLNVPAGQPFCAPRMKTDVCTGLNDILVGYNSDGSPNCVSSPVCGAGHVVNRIENGVLKCTKSVDDADCPDGQFVKKVTNGVPECGTLAPGGDILFVQKTSQIEGASQWNAIMDAERVKCKTYAPDSYCDNYYNVCKWDTAGTDGSGMDPNVYTTLTTSAGCQAWACMNTTNKETLLAHVIGACGPGATGPGVAPSCPPNGIPAIAYACMYK